MNIARWLLATARRNGSMPALLAGTEVVADYAEFAHRAAEIGERLRSDFGVEAGDRVALYAANRVEYLQCLYGIWWCGAVAVPVNAKLHPQEAAWILGNARAAVVLTDGHWDQALRDELVAADLGSIRLVPLSFGPFSEPGGPLEAPHELPGEALAWLFYTSGTTGRPKGAMLSHDNLVAMSLAYLADVDEASPADAAVYAAPLSHGAGLYNFVHVLRGSRHVVPASAGFDADEVLDLAARLRDVSMFAAPTMVRRLVAAARRRGLAGDGIKTIVYGGGPMYEADIVEAMDVMGDRFVQIYGQGESPMTASTLSRADHDAAHPGRSRHLSSVGVPHSVVDVRIVDAAGSVAPPGQHGEIEIAGPTVMAGYWANDEATRAAFDGRWLRTGDIGYLDRDGYLTLADRSKDVIISGGSNVYPREVEEVLLTHPAIVEAAVIGLPDPEWGEIVVACLVAEPGTDVADAELAEHCASAIARFKLPKRYERLDFLPKNNNGKVVKNDLREQLLATVSAG